MGCSTQLGRSGREQGVSLIGMRRQIQHRRRQLFRINRAIARLTNTLSAVSTEKRIRECVSRAPHLFSASYKCF